MPCCSTGIVRLDLYYTHVILIVAHYYIIIVTIVTNFQMFLLCYQFKHVLQFMNFER